MNQHTSKEWFYHVFHNEVTLMAICRIADGSFLEANGQFLEKLDYDHQEIRKCTWCSLAIEQGQGDITKNPPCGEIEMKTKSGKILTLHTCSVPITYHGESCRLHIGYDLTRQKEIIRELSRFDRLNLISEMAASIAHEIRNPLTTVRGYLQLFQMRPAFTDHLRQVNTMIEELDRANSIISQFLSLAKNTSPEKTPGNLNNVIQTLFPLVQADAFRMGHDATLHLGDLPDMKLDVQEIRQLFLNLTRNALEAMTSGGILTVRTFFYGDTLGLEVQDTGPGIPEDMLKEVTAPFVTTKEHGTGLGLPICYRIAEHHEGEMLIKSSPQGTTVTVRFKNTYRCDGENGFYQQQELFTPPCHFLPSSR